jgi:hypothetical protein
VEVKCGEFKQTTRVHRKARGHRGVWRERIVVRLNHLLGAPKDNGDNGESGVHGNGNGGGSTSSAAAASSLSSSSSSSSSSASQSSSSSSPVTADVVRVRVYTKGTVTDEVIGQVG